ncbi:MAG: SDR family oxidoreductase [Pseudomonadota bacterium]
MRYTDRTIVITGASDGIGAELARRLAPEGPRLALAARNAERLERVAADCRARGARAMAVTADVAIDGDCRRLVERAADEFGGIDVLVANAGVSMHARFDEIEDFSTFERLWRVNCLGTIACTRYAWPYLKAGRGQVVGVCSLAGRTGVPGRTTYCMSKFAQAGFLEALRIEAEDHGIAVTVVYPGVVATETRRRGFNGRGEPAGVSALEEAGAMPVDECARQIAAAMRARRRELVMTPKAKVGLWLKLIAPRVVDRMARAALKRQHSGSTT